MAPEQIGGGHKEDDGADSSKEKRGYRNHIDNDSNQGSLCPFKHRAQERKGHSNGFIGIVSPLDCESNVVDEKAADERGNRGHQEYGSNNDSEPRC